MENNDPFQSPKTEVFREVCMNRNTWLQQKPVPKQMAILNLANNTATTCVPSRLRHVLQRKIENHL